MVILLTTDYYL